MNFVTITTVIWICSAVGVIITKDPECFGYAFVATLFVGIGYLLAG